MDAIAMLKTDHDKMKKLLAELETTTERGVKTRAELFSTIKGELTVHEVIEEEVFYPELKAHPKAKDIVLEGYQEHHVVDLLMGELEQLDVSDETWGAKAKVMRKTSSTTWRKRKARCSRRLARSSMRLSSRDSAPGWPIAERAPSASSAYP